MPAFTYTLIVDGSTGKVQGVFRSDGVVVPYDGSNSDWRSFLTWNSNQQNPLSLASVPRTVRKPRLLPDVYKDLVALSSVQKTNVWNDLSAGTPAKYLTDMGAEPGAISVYDWALNFSGLQALALTDAKLRITAIYVRDNPNYLVNPSFDSSIVVHGDQLA